jgi:hypothetical protein
LMWGAKHAHDDNLERHLETGSTLSGSE